MQWVHSTIVQVCKVTADRRIIYHLLVTIRICAIQPDGMDHRRMIPGLQVSVRAKHTFFFHIILIKPISIVQANKAYLYHPTILTTKRKWNYSACKQSSPGVFQQYFLIVLFFVYSSRTHTIRPIKSTTTATTTLYSQCHIIHPFCASQRKDTYNK